MEHLRWDMIGAIFGGLSFLLTLLIEWDRLGIWRRIIVALIVGISIFSIITSLPAIISPSPSLTSVAPTLTKTPNVPKQPIALSDSFDKPIRGYDTDLWTCLSGSECGIENLALQNGALNLKRNNVGLTDILSRTKWDYSELESLSGKIKISSNSYQSQPNWGWISFHDHVAQCTISGSESPFIQCSVGGNSEAGSAEYYTEDFPIKFDTWYSIKMNLEHNNNSIKFYLDNKLIGEYTFARTPSSVQISLGIYAQTSTDYYIDDILLTLKQ